MEKKDIKDEYKELVNDTINDIIYEISPDLDVNTERIESEWDFDYSDDGDEL